MYTSLEAGGLRAGSHRQTKRFTSRTNTLFGGFSWNLLMILNIFVVVSGKLQHKIVLAAMITITWKLNAGENGKFA